MHLPVLRWCVAITQVGLILAQVITDGHGEDKTKQSAQKDDVKDANAGIQQQVILQRWL